jgi:FMN phosphatase YigB (HAD superfamily)
VLTALILDYGGVLTDPGDDRDFPLLRALLNARRHGLKTALLSNAGGTASDEITELFDVVVMDGVKPNVEAYERTAAALGVPAAECVFVDDLRGNVQGAVATGMVGVHHTDPATTLIELNALFGVDLE